MTIVIKSKKQIVALHYGQVFIFSVEALEGRRAIPKEKNTVMNSGHRVVGIYFDDDFKRIEVFEGQQLVRMFLCKHIHTSYDETTGITECAGCGCTKPKNDSWSNAESVVITKERLKSLEYDSDKLNALEAGGVDNWDFYDDSLEEFRAERE